LTTSKNPFPYKQDSIIHTNKYQYNKENKIGEISKINNHKNSIGKNHTSVNTEQHTYLKEGLIHGIKHLTNYKLIGEDLLVHNSKGKLTEYTNHWLNPDRTTKYLFDSKGSTNKLHF